MARAATLGKTRLENESDDTSSLDVQLIHYFTCGPDEVRAWTIRDGTLAPKAAGVIQYVLFSPCKKEKRVGIA